MEKIFKNKRLNNLYGHQELRDSGSACPKCGAKLYSFTENMGFITELGGGEMQYCEDVESHVFEMFDRPRRLVEFKRPPTIRRVTAQFVKQYSEEEVLEVLRQCLFFGMPEYYEQGGINKNINFPPNGTHKKAKDYFERFYLNKKAQ